MCQTRQNEEIIGEWYEKYSSSLFQFILLNIQDHHQAEDITQEAFLKAYTRLHTFDFHSQPKTWLFRIAYNLAMDNYRKKAPIAKLKELLHMQRTQEKSAEEIVIIQERAQDIYKALQELKGSYRNVIILRKIKEFSTKETSQILGWSESKVKSTLSRAMMTLDKIIVKEGLDEQQKSASQNSTAAKLP